MELMIEKGGKETTYTELTQKSGKHMEIVFTQEIVVYASNTEVFEERG